MPMLRLSLRLYTPHPLETLRLYILSILHTPARTGRLYTPRNVAHVTLHAMRCGGDPPPHGPNSITKCDPVGTGMRCCEHRYCRGLVSASRAHGHEELSTINPYSIGGVCFTHGIKHRKSRRLEHPRTRTQTYALRRLTYTPQVNHTVPIHYGIRAHDGVMKRDATRSPYKPL